MSSEPSDDDAKKLSQLETRIAEAKKALEPKARADEHFSQANLAWRMVIELVSGLGIGFGIGYGADVVFGTLPIFLVVFTFLGLAAGVRVMMRTAAEVGAGEVAKGKTADDTASREG
ncbi:AtpZ/AtpI family protein [Phaeovulum sp. W22_SRMD_FR3]|uniref:AtpZ/AtpI family protein n=1 Tax=Phaeovulum sp. W22_SRMD_FR3 TaxID=3240274 RepID=UPI003F973BF9